MLVFAGVSIVGSGLVVAARTQNSRPRSVVAAPAATPTPTPIPTTNSARQSASYRDTSGYADANAPTHASNGRANPIDRITPQLGEPPPPPVLKPKPTPTPPEEFDEDEIVKVNTELVTLNVRVIDRK